MNKRDMRPLWIGMLGIYGHRWESAYGSNPETNAAGALWERGLRDVTDVQVRAGIEACIHAGEGWPPTLPEFRAMCLDIPSLAAVRLAILSGDAPEGARRFMALVWRHLDGWRMRQAPVERADRMIADAYSLARDSVLRGEPLPEAPAGVIAPPIQPERKPASPETVSASMAAVAAALGLAAESRRIVADPQGPMDEFETFFGDVP